VWDEAVASAGRRSVELRLDVLRREGRAVALELLLAALERLGSGRGEVTSSLLAKAWQVIAGRAGGQTVELPGGARLVRRGDRVRLTAGGRRFRAGGRFLLCAGEVEL
jgi:hypothetical protein